MSITRLIWKCRHIGVVLLGLQLLSACTSLGHRKVPGDRFNYNAAIVQSRNEQMLLNLVRLRYLEIPDFLAVSSVITSYNYDGSVGVASTRADGNSDIVPDTLRGNANLAYAERPTITYTPLAGQEFAQRMFKPIPVEAVFSLGHAGWPVDILMSITLQRMNDVENMGFGQVPSPGDLDKAQQFEREKEKLQRFQRVLQLMMLLVGNEALEVQQVKGEESTLSHLHFKRDLPVGLQRLVDELKRELNLDPGRNTFRVTKRMTERDADEITIQSRSLMSIMSFLSRGIDVPRAGPGCRSGCGHSTHGSRCNPDTDPPAYTFAKEAAQRPLRCGPLSKPLVLYRSFRHQEQAYLCNHTGTVSAGGSNRWRCGPAANTAGRTLKE